MNDTGGLLFRFGSVVSERIGIGMEHDKVSGMRRAASLAGAALGIGTPEATMAFFLSGKAVEKDWETLYEHLTVGESYFFRDPPFFENLKTFLMPEILGGKGASGDKVKIWSAGCACGQEPYSLAILFDNDPSVLKSLSVEIFASDVNSRFLGEARKGIYRSWSLRGLDEKLRDRYFTLKPGGDFALVPRIRNKVNFFRVNLVNRGDFVEEFSKANFDLILCRNVLMYFSENKRHAALENLARALAPGGFFATSPSETGAIRREDLESLRTGRSIFFRKIAGGKPVLKTGTPVFPGPASGNPTGSFPCTPLRACALEKKELSSRLPVSPTVMEQGSVAVENETSTARAFAAKASAEAGAGRYDSALAFCLKSVDADKFNPTCRYLLSGIFLETGDAKAAEKALKETLYLDPGFVLAHIALARLADMGGKTAEAEKYFANAAGLLKKFAPDEIVPHSGGMTAFDILESLPRRDRSREQP